MSVRRLKRALTCYRLVRGANCDPLDATASTVFPGRWNRSRDAVLYAYERLATAVLEALVGGGGLLRPDLHYVALSVPFGVFYETADAAAILGWDADPPLASATFGATWLNSKALLLFAPSVVLHTERVVVFNPRRRSFARVVAGPPTPLRDIAPALVLSDPS